MFSNCGRDEDRASWCCSGDINVRSPTPPVSCRKKYVANSHVNEPNFMVVVPSQPVIPKQPVCLMLRIHVLCERQ